ncbi:MAG: TIGR03086 family metal-binding protein [Mycobacterium sp.]
MDELVTAEAALTVLDRVLRPVTAGDLARQTPCREYDVASLTGHLLNSITTLGGAAGAQFPQPDPDASVHRQVTAAAQPALAAWRQRGVDGNVALGPDPLPARVAVGILSIEFLVHAWDYAAATGQQLDVPEEVSARVEQLARGIITPEGRKNVGFDPPVELPAEAPAFDRLLAFTGRRSG